MDPPATIGPASPEQRAHLALLRLSAVHRLDPVPDDELRSALSEIPGADVDELREALVREDIARRIPEGWVLRGHGPKTASSRWRLLLPDH